MTSTASAMCILATIIIRLSTNIIHVKRTTAKHMKCSNPPCSPVRKYAIAPGIKDTNTKYGIAESVLAMTNEPEP